MVNGMNDITGSDVRCPQCKIGWTQPTFVGDDLYFICACGYGKEEYFNAVQKKKEEEKIGLQKTRRTFPHIFSKHRKD